MTFAGVGGFVFNLTTGPIINSRNSMVISLSAAFAATLWGYLIDFAGFQVMWICGIIVAVLSAVFAFAAICASKKLPKTTASEDAKNAA